MKYFNEINSAKYCYLDYIGEPEDNSLKLVVAQAQLNKVSQGKNLDLGEFSCSPVAVNRESQVFEFLFDTYIGYSVIDESMASLSEDSEVYAGEIFRVYSKSNYLDYIKKATFACDDYPGPYVHYEINCLNHIVNVVSVDEPCINKLP